MANLGLDEKSPLNHRLYLLFLMHLINKKYYVFAVLQY